MATPITVGMRMRPLVPREAGQLHCLALSGNQVAVVDAVVEDAVVEKGTNDVCKGGPKEFAFDYAMDSSDPSSDTFCGQERCYEIMGQPMLETALKGYNTCLFCYGQTGTGKTTTIMGEPEPVAKQGLLMRLLFELFAEVARLEGEGTKVLTQVQMLEVYNEELRDLIVAKKDKDESKVKISVTPRQGAQLVGATEAMVPSFKDTVKLLDYGNSNKTIAATAMNPQSSRGHTVFRLNVTRKGGDGSTVASALYFADLAGAENQKTTLVTGDRLKELTFINRSLMFLAQAIQALSQRKSSKTDMSIFRNSKLTLLLSNALIGNSRTSMIGTLSPALLNFEESYKTLKFASTVKSIKIEASVAASMDPAVMVKKLQDEVKGLKEQLKVAQGGPGGSAAGTDNEDLQLQLKALQEQVERQRKDWSELQQEAQEQADLREEAMTTHVIAKILGKERAADEEQQEEALRYCQQILHGLPGNDRTFLHAFLRSTLKAKQLVDQANTLTNEVKPRSGFVMELAFTSKVLGHGQGQASLPELCVRVLREMSVARVRWKWAVDSLKMRKLSGVLRKMSRLATQELPLQIGSAESRRELLYTWSWKKFTGRLARMHALHARWAEARDPAGLDLEEMDDPWIELESDTQQHPEGTVAMSEHHHDAEEQPQLHKRKAARGTVSRKSVLQQAPPSSTLPEKLETKAEAALKEDDEKKRSKSDRKAGDVKKSATDRKRETKRDSADGRRLGGETEALQKQKTVAEEKLATVQEQLRDARQQLKDALRDVESFKLQAQEERDRNEKLLVDMDELDHDNLALCEECEQLFEENVKLRNRITGGGDIADDDGGDGGFLGWMFGNGPPPAEDEMGSDGDSHSDGRG
mmetsp:Transcript_58903/g.137644  ORF Transcript_58903/g.137644 Transcript_58903/m.137644 type:complete len:868 (-) Transcript_58903:60-2663(-)